MAEQPLGDRAADIVPTTPGGRALTTPALQGKLRSCGGLCGDETGAQARWLPSPRSALTKSKTAPLPPAVLEVSFSFVAPSSLLVNLGGTLVHTGTVRLAQSRAV